MKLTAKARNKLPGSTFAGPDRSFPINDLSHARNALSRVSGHSSELKAKVRAAVHRKFPGIKQHDAYADGGSVPTTLSGFRANGLNVRRQEQPSLLRVQPGPQTTPFDDKK